MTTRRPLGPGAQPSTESVTLAPRVVRPPRPTLITWEERQQQLLRVDEVLELIEDQYGPVEMIGPDYRLPTDLPRRRLGHGPTTG